jgi:hypothetical protein
LATIISIVLLRRKVSSALAFASEIDCTAQMNLHFSIITQNKSNIISPIIAIRINFHSIKIATMQSRGKEVRNEKVKVGRYARPISTMMSTKKYFLVPLNKWAERERRLKT